jgi:hypothetical protein
MKQFVLREKTHADSLIAYLREHAGDQARAGRPLCVTVTEHKSKRSVEQNARYWSLLSEIAEQVEVGGKRFGREVWHEWARDRFAAKIDGPTGLLAASTTTMNVEEFAKYMTQVEVFAVQDLGVEFAYI